MNFKTILSFCALAFVSVNASDLQSSKNTCNQKQGMFLEASDPSDNRYGCLVPQTHNALKDGLFCTTYDDYSGCYDGELGNMTYCDKPNSIFDGINCGISIGYLYHDMKTKQNGQISNEEKKRRKSRNICNQKQGLFLEANDPNDTRYACLLPQTQDALQDGLYCTTYYDYSGCYSAELGNIAYCDAKSSEFNSRGCGLGLGYLYNGLRYNEEKKKHNQSRKTCNQKQGMFFEANDASDTRYACLLPQTHNDLKDGIFCATINDWSGCYAADLGNMDSCNKYTNKYHHRACALEIGYLYYDLKVAQNDQNDTETSQDDQNNTKTEEEKRQENKDNCKRNQGIFLESIDPNDTRYACLLPQTNADLEKGLYCGTYDNFSGCYAAELSNITYCDYKSSDFNKRSCGLGLGYLYYGTKAVEEKKLNQRRETCYQSHGMFLENNKDASDKRYACLLPQTHNDLVDGLYCDSYNNWHACYAPDLGNIDYCNPKSSLFDRRDCRLGINYLYYSNKY